MLRKLQPRFDENTKTYPPRTETPAFWTPRVELAVIQALNRRHRYSLSAVLAMSGTATAEENLFQRLGSGAPLRSYGEFIGTLSDLADADETRRAVVPEARYELSRNRVKQIVRSSMSQYFSIPSSERSEVIRIAESLRMTEMVPVFLNLLKDPKSTPKDRSAVITAILNLLPQEQATRILETFLKRENFRRTGESERLVEEGLLNLMGSLAKRGSAQARSMLNEYLLSSERPNAIAWRFAHLVPPSSELDQKWLQSLLYSNSDWVVTNAASALVDSNRDDLLDQIISQLASNPEGSKRIVSSLLFDLYAAGKFDRISTHPFRMRQISDFFQRQILTSPMDGATLYAGLALGFAGDLVAMPHILKLGLSCKSTPLSEEMRYFCNYIKPYLINQQMSKFSEAAREQILEIALKLIDEGFTPIDGLMELLESMGFESEQLGEVQEALKERKKEEAERDRLERLALRTEGVVGVPTTGPECDAMGYMGNYYPANTGLFAGLYAQVSLITTKALWDEWVRIFAVIENTRTAMTAFANSGRFREKTLRPSNEEENLFSGITREADFQVRDVIRRVEAILENYVSSEGTPAEKVGEWPQIQAQVSRYLPILRRAAEVLRPDYHFGRGSALEIANYLEKEYTPAPVAGRQNRAPAIITHSR